MNNLSQPASPSIQNKVSFSVQFHVNPHSRPETMAPFPSFVFARKPFGICHAPISVTRQPASACALSSRTVPPIEIQIRRKSVPGGVRPSQCWQPTRLNASYLLSKASSSQSLHKITPQTTTPRHGALRVHYYVIRIVTASTKASKAAERGCQKLAPKRSEIESQAHHRLTTTRSIPASESSAKFAGVRHCVWQAVTSKALFTLVRQNATNENNCKGKLLSSAGVGIS